MSVVHRVEGTGQQHMGKRRRQHHLAVGLDGDAIDLARKKPIDGVHDRLGKMFVRIEQAAWRPRGNSACAGQPQHDRARNEVFLRATIAPALGHHAGAVGNAGTVVARDVKPVFTPTRAIAHQGRRRAETDQVGARRHQFGCACSRSSRQRDRGVGAARLRR
jgi:hypothetical protein